MRDRSGHAEDAVSPRPQKMNTKQRIAQNIITLREASSMARDVLAEKANIAPRRLQDIEESRVSLQVDEIESISRGLGVDPVELFVDRSN